LNGNRETLSILFFFAAEVKPLFVGPIGGHVCGNWEREVAATEKCVTQGFYLPEPNQKSGKRRAMSAHLGWQAACELGFRGNLDKWKRWIK
jgi:hypothetical protein